ncbi:MAG: thiol reductant ABC exporter subunit CydC [Melioribacteraceae bacterium]
MREMTKAFLKILLLGKEYKYWMILAAVIGFFTVGSGIGLMMTSAYLIAKAAIQTPIYQLQVAIVGVRFFGIARGVFRYLERYISHEVTFRLLAKFRVWFFQSLIPRVPSKTNDLSSGDLLTRSIEDIESLEHIFVRVISPVLVFVGVALLMFFLLLMFGISYAVVFIFMFFASAVTIPLLTFLLSKKLGEKIVLLKSKLKDFSIDGISGIQELIVFGQQEKWLVEFHRIQNDLILTEKRMNRIMSFHEGLSGFAMNITVAIMLFIAIPDVTLGKLNGVYLTVITIGIMASFEIITQIPLAFQYLTKSVEAGNRLFEIADNEVLVDKTNVSEKIKLDGFDIAVNDVSFSYENEINTLSNVSFSIKKNKKIAIVGASGSGKSTIVNLLTRLWKYDSGEISIGKLNYDKVDEEQIRNLISVVPQKVHLFTGTVKDNLSIAKQDATDEELFNALEQVDMKKTIENLPDNLNTNIGEYGKKLSGGEAKRLSIARALLRNSPILIFDEINSHVDAITERKILAAIKNISPDKGILFITHRIVGMEMFDEILVLSDGKISERGTHLELLANGKIYSRLIRSQNQSLNF